MNRRTRRGLIFVLIALGLVLLGVVLLAFVPDTMGHDWGRPHCPWCGGTGDWSPWRLLIMLLVPLSLVVILIVGTVWLAQGGWEPEPDPRLTCPECGEPVQPNWEVCPYCGKRLQE